MVWLSGILNRHLVRTNVSIPYQLHQFGEKMGMTLRFQARGPKRYFVFKKNGQNQEFCLMYYYWPLV